VNLPTRFRPRRVLRLLHRDIGYVLFGLTAIYAVSGLAVNHIRDWNPNYRVTRTDVAIGPVGVTDLDGMEAAIVARLGLPPGEVTGRHRPDPNTFVLFLPEGGEVRVDVRSGKGRMERFRPRPGLYESNVLHLNRLKGAWTYVADAFALLLLFLAVSGLFMLKGRTGLAGRGKWLVGIGLVLPLAFLVRFYWH
jgi:uncharacterized protein